MQWRNRFVLAFHEFDLLKIEEEGTAFTTREYNLSFNYLNDGLYRFVISRIRVDLVGISKLEVLGRKDDNFQLTLFYFDKSFYPSEPLRTADYDLYNFYILDVRKLGASVQTAIKVNVDWDTSETPNKYFLLLQGFLYETRP
jgi:hypothetical protein